MKKIIQKSYNMNIIYVLMPILICIAKFIRYTIMKTVLVDAGIGNFFLKSILYDSNLKIKFFSEGGVSEAGGNTVAIFKFINFLNLTTYIQFEVFITFIWNILLVIILFKAQTRLSELQLSFIILSIIVLNIFDFTLAKEPIQMLFFILIYLVLICKSLNKTNKFILSVIIIIFSALFFRIYYLLIAFFSISVGIILSIDKRKNKKTGFKKIVKYIILLGIIYFMFLVLCKVLKPNEYSELIRVRTRVGGAKSDMINIFRSDNLVLFVLDYLLMLIRMLLPIELLPLGIKYVPYVLYQVVITFFIIKALRNFKNNDSIKNIALIIYLGFILGSAAFEPDFGSWVRHEAVIFPILMLIAEIYNKNQYA